MSLIVAIHDKDRFVFGADKQSSVAGGKEHTATKIWCANDMPGLILGSVGSRRVSQIIQYSDIIDKNYLQETLDTDFIVNSLVPVLMGTLKNMGVIVDPPEDAAIPRRPNSFLVAYKDKGWCIWNDFSVSEINGYTALGSGSDLAKGSLYSTGNLNPFQRAVLSIGAASESDLYVDNGIDLLTTKTYPQDILCIHKALGLPVTDNETTAKKKKTRASKKLVKSKT